MTQRSKVTNQSTEDINILLLGPTGVGKSTFINAFANYLVYNTLDAAINGELQAIIPAWFTFTDNATYEEKQIMIGQPSQHEKPGGVGESCTRECQSFVFRIDNRNLRLIDAPGIGDTQGVLQDEKNFEDILAYISQFEYLNGICILLKPNEERLNILFRFCVKELLRHLHVQAKENIMFVFTNARSTSFQPGSSAPLLKSLLKGLRNGSNTDVPFSKENSFLLDNEAFRFLALCKNGIKFPPEQKQDYSRSWEYTIKEFSRLISHIATCALHAVRDTVSLNAAQQLVRKLSRPIGEIATLIEQNIQLAKQHKENLANNQVTDPHLMPQMDAKVVPLGHPRTVCTNSKCTQAITIDGVATVNYTSHCHPHCFLTGVEQEVIGHEKLKDCTAIDKKLGTCYKCGCLWKEHMHITYEFEKYFSNIDINTSNNTKSPTDAVDQRIKDLKQEEEAIIKVCTQLSQFLRINALNPVNDDILEYIQHFIREEQTKKNAGVKNDDVIAGLEKLLVDYTREMEVFQKLMQSSPVTASVQTNPANPANALEPEAIFLLVGSLYRLPINGSKIRAQVDELKRNQAKFSLQREQKVNLPPQATSSTVMCELKKIVC